MYDRRFLFQQDNAPSHNAPETKQELQERGIPVINWPPNSPNLNIIEDAWNIMKDYISKHYDENIIGDTLRQAVYKVWDIIEESFLEARLATMPARIEAVIVANGMHTKY